MKQNIIDSLNQMAGGQEAFLFVINYAGTEAYIRKLADIAPDECLYGIEGVSNAKDRLAAATDRLPKWDAEEMKEEDYRERFDIVRGNMLRGNSYLANLTCRVKVDCDMTFEEIFRLT